jgi:hypothetical protein
MDTCTVDGIRCLANLFRCTIGSTKTGLDQLFTILVEKIKGGEMSTSGDLD